MFFAAVTTSGRARYMHNAVQDRKDRDHKGDPHAGGRGGVSARALRHYIV